MKRNFILVSAFTIVSVLFFATSLKLQSHVTRPLTGGLAGNPGQSNCSACHSAYGAPIFRNSQFIIRIASDSAGLANDSSIISPTNNHFIPNYTQWVSLELTGINTNAAPDSPFYGFQFTALKASPNDSMAGSFILVDPYTSTQNSSYNGNPTPQGVISYVSHYNPNMIHSINKWYFKWVAPDSASGPVTFYYSGNLGNGNLAGDPSLDYPNSDTIFTGSITLNPGHPTGITNLSGNISAASVYPVPFGQQLNVNMHLIASGNVTLSLITIEGQTIKNLYMGNVQQGSFSKSFDIADIAAGVYFVQIQAGTDTKVIKVFKY